MAQFHLNICSSTVWREQTPQERIAILQVSPDEEEEEEEAEPMNWRNRAANGLPIVLHHAKLHDRLPNLRLLTVVRPQNADIHRV